MKKKTLNKTTLKVLYLEDSPRDVEIIRGLLIDAGYDLSMDCAEEKKEFTSFLRSQTYDIILSDFKLPGFDAFGALQLAIDICPNVPFICISGSIGEEIAIELIKQGAVDYILKDRLVRFPLTIKRALDEVKEKQSLRIAKDALHESEDKFKYVFDHSLFGISIAYPSGEIHVNKALCEMLGYKEEELQSQTWQKITHPDDIELTQKALDPLYNGKQDSTQFIKRYIHKSGAVVWADVGTFVRRNEENKPFYFITNIINITERKLAEEALRESELKFRTVADFTYDWEYWENENNKIEYISPSCERISGYSQQKFIKDPSLLIKIVHPEDVDYVKQHHERVFTYEHKHNVDELEFRIIHKDGSVIPIYHVCRPIYDEFNKYHGRRISNRDITKRKLAEDARRESEERFRSLFENMLNGFAYCRMIFVNGRPQDFIYLNVNKAFESLTGLKNVTGKKASDVIPGIRESDSDLLEIYGRVALTGKPETFEMFVESLNNWYFISVYSPKKEFFISVFDVITERKREEEEIGKSHEELRMLANHLQTIREEEWIHLAREFHDQLGQSLTALKMDLSLLLRMISDEKQNISRQYIAEELKSAQKLVDETTQSVWEIVVDLRPQMLDDLGLLAALEWETERFKARTGISCEFKSSAGDIQLDPKKSIALFRIYQEALTNIARHANATVVKSVLQWDDEMLVLEIKDNGCGISIDEQFKQKPFGLISMRERALAIGGSFKISGAAGEGTTIMVRLPLG